MVVFDVTINMSDFGIVVLLVSTEMLSDESVNIVFALELAYKNHVVVAILGAVSLEQLARPTTNASRKHPSMRADLIAAIIPFDVYPFFTDLAGRVPTVKVKPSAPSPGSTASTVYPSEASTVTSRAKSRSPASS